MNTPAPKTSPDAALGNLMAAALDVPAASEQPALPDDTLARTGNTADHQAGWFAGMEQGQANAQANMAIRAPSRDWKAIQAAIDEYLDGYELRTDEGAHTPTDFERFLLDDCIAGLLADDDFLALMAARPAPIAGNARADRDAAFEAVRKRLCALPRYSFWKDDNGGVKRVNDRSGNWIEFDAAHGLFDAVAVDAAIAAQQGKGGAA
ncbi:hypothetical protein ACOTDE_26500 [Achromobacter xylosoxidans]